MAKAWIKSVIRGWRDDSVHKHSRVPAFRLPSRNQKSGTATHICHPSVGEVQSHVQANTFVIIACNEVYRYILATQKTLVKGSKV